MPVLPLSSDYDGKSLRHYQVDKQTVVGYFFAVRLLRIMYCVHEPANVAGTWHSARYSAGTNLLPDRDILRAVMSRNKMVEMALVTKYAGAKDRPRSRIGRFSSKDFNN